MPDSDDGEASPKNASNMYAISKVGEFVDRGEDEQNSEFIDAAFSLAEHIRRGELTPTEAALLDYCVANAWAFRYAQRRVDPEAAWDFDQPEITEQVRLLRRAAYGPGFAGLSTLNKCQILTNLGNQFDSLGRFIEARACWNAALVIDPNFWMAKANRGRALMSYGCALYDDGHLRVFAHHAHSELRDATDLIEQHPQLGDSRLLGHFSTHADAIARQFDLSGIAASYRPDEGDMGETADERDYRAWCLSHTLFLNPLNDVVQAPIAAQDVLHLPSFTAAIDEPPVVVGMFNELKQAYASARYMLWESDQSDGAHFSDRDVLLLNTLDYPAYGLATEQLKMAFRVAYSVFDKIALFLNRYLELGMGARQVNFRAMWVEGKDKALRSRIAGSKNWPLRGLYWLSKDLFEEGAQDLLEPDARRIAELRNLIEHRFLRVVDDGFPIPDDSDAEVPSISRGDLERRTLRLFQLARSALIYLSLAMHHEERTRKREGLAMPMHLGTFDDEWKR